MTTVRPRIPDRLISHEAHEYERPSGYDSKPIRIECPGDHRVSSCSVVRERERLYLEGFIDGVRSTSGYDISSIRPIQTESEPEPELDGDRAGAALAEREEYDEPKDSEPEKSQPDPEPLREWWVRTATEDIDRTMSKIREYGGSDLLMMGQALTRITGHGLSNEEAQELGCWIYIEGKLARAISALAEQRRPSDDTILDAAFYLFMIRRIRDSGRWP